MRMLDFLVSEGAVRGQEYDSTAGTANANVRIAYNGSA
jgi:hypothetical protein